MALKVMSAALSVRLLFQHTAASSPSFSLDVSFDVPAGITILFGPSGSGKSTLLDCLAGLLTPLEGRISVNGELLFDSSSAVNFSPQVRRVAYVFQSLALFPHLTVEENIHYGLAGFSPQEKAGHTEAILDAFHVRSLRARKPRDLSGGEKQRVALARSLVTHPRLLLLDEPLTGLEAGLKSSIIDDLRSWNALHRIPILYVTHNREEVDALGERVIALNHGRVVSTGTPQEVLDAPRRTRLAQSAGFENLLVGRVLELREEDGVMPVRLGNSAAEIEVPLAHASPGDEVRLAVRAGDILLASEFPSKLSARNVLEGTIESIEQRGSTVVCRVLTGVPFVVHVTPGALRSLELAPRRRVWLVLKTHSCHLVDD